MKQPRREWEIIESDWNDSDNYPWYYDEI
jgi:hypothetical protein